MHLIEEGHLTLDEALRPMRKAQVTLEIENCVLIGDCETAANGTDGLHSFPLPLSRTGADRLAE
jgi:hypothetical protein